MLTRYANLVKLPHTVFALPFALLGVLYASFTHGVTVGTVAIVTLAFAAARFAAMGFNRIVDRQLDAANPRTQERELPRGRLSVRQAWGAVFAACAVFVMAAWQLNPLCLALSPVALLWVLGYSYSKRFTSWSHVWLGGSLAIAPVAGFLAVTGRWGSPWWTLVVIAVAVLTWVAGFDIFYALQDEAFDRTHGLRSAVVALGDRASIVVGKMLHTITIASLLLFGFLTPFGWLYVAGVAVAASVLVWEHQMVRPGDLSRVDAAFFRMNGILSVVMFGFALMDRVL